MMMMMMMVTTTYNYTHIHAETKSTIMTNEHTSLGKYTSHTLFEMVGKELRKGYVWEVSWRLNKLQHIDTQIPLTLAALLSRSAAAQSGVLRIQSPLLGAGSLYSIISPTNWLQTNCTSCRTGLYHCFTSHLISVSVSSAPHSTRPQSRLYTDIFDRMHLYLDWRLGGRYYLPTPPLGQDMTQGQFLSGV